MRTLHESIKALFVNKKYVNIKNLLFCATIQAFLLEALSQIFKQHELKTREHEKYFQIKTKHIEY